MAGKVKILRQHFDTFLSDNNINPSSTIFELNNDGVSKPRPLAHVYTKNNITTLSLSRHLLSNYNIDMCLAVLYHELGHVVDNHKDSFLYNSISKNTYFPLIDFIIFSSFFFMMTFASATGWLSLLLFPVLILVSLKGKRDQHRIEHAADMCAVRHGYGLSTINLRMSEGFRPSSLLDRSLTKFIGFFITYPSNEKLLESLFNTIFKDTQQLE